MPLKKMLQQMEGYHLPKNDTEEAGLVNKCATEQNPNKTCAESSYNSATQKCLTQNATYDADASNADTSNANASNANASYPNASYANASNANASNANASYPNASYANASNANASYANANASYAKANALNANASNANASNDNASYANASNDNASYANASYANASYANANASYANAQKDQNAQKDPYANENNVSDNNDPESYDPDTDINDPESYDQDFVTNDHHTDTNETVHGSFNQGHTRFGKNSGRQCVANSAMAMMYNQIKDISTWDSHDLDTVLCRGNKLYEDSINQRQSTSRSAYLLVSDICPTVDFFGKEYRFVSGDSLTGFVMKDTEEIVDIPQQMCLDAALQTIFSQHDATFVTFGGSTFAVIERNNKYHVFDSHSRNTEGLQVTNGTSILIQYTSLLQVYEHCLNLARSMNLNANSQFEMTGMRITTGVEPHDNRSDNASDTNDNDDVVHIDELEDNSQDVEPHDNRSDNASDTNENDEVVHIDELEDNSRDVEPHDNQSDSASDTNDNDDVVHIDELEDNSQDGSVEMIDIDTNETVHGSFNQGHTRFGKNSGRQCVANSAMAMMYNQIKDISTWDSYDLDTVLCRGNKLYEDSINQRQSTSRSAYLLVSDICPTVDFFGKEYRFVSGDSLSGFVMKDTEEIVDNPQQMCLDAALQTIFSQHDATFVTFGGSTFAVIERNNKYHVFDSHSRNTEGLQVTNGTSILIQYTSLLQVYEHCLNLARSMNLNANSQFEMTGMKISTDIQPHDNQSDNASDTNDNDDVVHIDEDGTVDMIEIDQSDDTACETNENDQDDMMHIDECDDNSQDGSLKETGTDQHAMLFCPVSSNVCEQLCKKLDIQHQCVAKSQDHEFGVEIDVPCRTVSIEGDGNCFFRSLSYAISGKENNHRKIRLAIVTHLKEHAQSFHHFLRPGYESVEQYISQSRMWYVGTWATELEILAAANLLGTDICTYSDNRWLRYSSRQLNSDTVNTGTGIYLNHVGGSHYEVVVCVNTVDALRNSCTDKYCQRHMNIKRNADQLSADLLNDRKSVLKKQKCSDSKEKRPDHRPTKKPKGKYAQAKAKREYMRAKRELEKDNSETLNLNVKQRRLAKENEKYNTDLDFKNRKKLQSSNKYKDDEAHREFVKKYSTNKYATVSEHKETVKAYSSQKYATDSKHREDVKTYSSQKYATDSKHREDVKTYSSQKYATDSKHKEDIKSYSSQQYRKDAKHKEALKNLSSEKYAKDEKHRENKKNNSIEKYANDEKHRESVKTNSTEKYANDEKHRENVKTNSTEKYANDEKHRESVKTNSTEKYANDEKHRESVKTNSTEKYAKDEKHRENVKTNSIKKYAKDAKHRESVKSASIAKYKASGEHRTNLKERQSARVLQLTKERKIMENVTQSFAKNISEGPEFVCSVCHRRLFKKQVVQCKRTVYENKGSNIATVAERCITENYLHRCSDSCDDQCSFVDSPEGTLWICYTCHRKLLSGKMPGEAVVNNLELTPVPMQLQCLNELEQHLIALNIPFMKMMALPKGGQHGVHGPVVCVPSNIQKSTSMLPRSDIDDQMIRVKLKRKITYKGHYQYQFVNKAHVKNALEYLQTTNKWYSDVNFNTDWVNPLPVIDEEDEIIDSDTETLPEVEKDSSNTQTNENEESEKDHGLLMNTCLQPLDIGQEVMDQYFEKITCIAPAEENNPVRLLTDKSNEARSFPVLFPSGSPTFHDDREERITIARYLHTRLMNADSRFAQNTDYIFYAQYLSEIDQVMSNVSIAMRKGSQSHGKNVTSENLTDSDSLREILKCDEGYKFLKPIRGTPPYWQSAQKDLFAMIRQLGIPTWFCSFSSADMRWPEMIETILREAGDTRKATELDWSEKCSILRKNPVTAARMFDQRFHCFLKEVIMSPAEPIGKIKDYFYRVEFQHRGSPHTHCLFWVENAPKVDDDNDESVTSFIDKYVTCDMPSVENDEELFDIVNSVQKHSKRHSKTCKKNGTTCRFNFPRPPSNETFISRAGGLDNKPKDVVPKTLKQCCEDLFNMKFMSIPDAQRILKLIWQGLTNDEQTFESVDALFSAIGISQDIFQLACDTLSKKTNVVMKRNPNDVWVNQYNADLLRCWNANMDIQYIVDAYSCVVYIISYISKAEREMGLLLNHAQTEANKDNSDAKSALKKLGAVYLHNREVSAQEAVFRVCNLRLKEGSRKVQFIPTVDPVRMSLPLKTLQNKRKSGELDEDEMWMTSIVDRYKSRPKGDEFDNMCLATFCSEYRVLPKSEVSNVSDDKRRSPVVTLQNGLGHVKKRTRTDAAVIRYARFSRTKNPEKHYHSILQLFLPYTFDAQLKPPAFNSYEEFYETGAVQIENCPLETVKEIVDRNKAMFEKDGDVIDEAEELFDKTGQLEDAWAQICPETESERIACEVEHTCTTDEESESETAKNMPDLLLKDNTLSKTEVLQSTMSKQEAETILRSMNEEQAEVFYKIRQWCLDKRNGKNPDAFNLFLTGGAGTGKSHLIKAICYECTRLLAPMQNNPDDNSVLLVAPTGIAAFNIHASTIHSALSIGIDAKLPYQPLGEEKINSLRAKLQSIHILIIDEISMVDHKLLSYIHGRLRQIKQTADYSPFGNVSVIAVGDFYQLSPVKGTPLHVAKNGYDLWNDNFSIAELTEIMRQKDPAFAQLLNRLRTRKKSDPLDTRDIHMLKQQETGEDDPESIHIFATNAQVDEYNIAALHSKCSDPICIDAQDFSRNAKTGKLEKREIPHGKVHNSVLQKSLNVAIGARVMITKNIDTSDGLVNGVFGTISHISLTDGERFPSKIHIVFDKIDVGQKLRRMEGTASELDPNSTPIKPQEETVSNNGGIRRQFPLKLAWACTIHKVQGITVNKAVVSLHKVFAAGQAYVALSRVSSLDGLIIQNFKESVIYSSVKVEAAVSSMPKFMTRNQRIYDGHPTCTLIMQNIEGLQSHIKDLQNDKRFLESDFICLTETWLSDSHPADEPKLDGFTLHHKPRSKCYESSEPILMQLKNQRHGGVGVYSSEVKTCEFTQLPVSNLEYLCMYVMEVQAHVVVIYRPSSYTVDIFRKHMLQLVQELDNRSGRSIIMGDFNENILSSSSIQTMMESNGFTQMVSEPTTEGGTLLDHVYVKGLENVSVQILPTYFGYHEAIEIKL
ncbi:uncharacterized protein LOC125382713 [Haliotis rufescens]|uniref:uncharacterized protein LOC125382713 n=1 Tax=Haliotis rufescens TaxID=6454 RepID=UPI00201E9AAD|nr:uncharacterized protein LOC125382713 [Haliotis rufescens]